MRWARSHWRPVALGAGLFLLGIGIGAATVPTKTQTVAGPTTAITRSVTKVRTVSKVRVRTVRAQPPPTPPPRPPPPASPPPAQAADKDFAVQTLQIRDDGLGDIGGIVRVTNTSAETLTATFTITFFQGGSVVGTAGGAANDVAPGQTVTVQLVSQDPIFSGNFRYQFQVDTEF